VTIPPCAFCGQTFSKQHYEHHLDICNWRPDYLPAERQLILELSTSAASCTKELYSRRRASGYKSGLRLATIFEGWANVLKWAAVPPVTCRHCQGVFSCVRTKSNHERVCMSNPELAQAVRAYLYQMAAEANSDPTLDDYDRNRPKSFPSRMTIIHYFGSWSAVKDWAGVQGFWTDHETTNQRIGRMADLSRIHPERQESDITLQALEGTRVFSAWNIRKHRYEAAYKQVTYMVR